MDGSDGWPRSYNMLESIQLGTLSAKLVLLLSVVSAGWCGVIIDVI